MPITRLCVRLREGTCMKGLDVAATTTVSASRLGGPRCEGIGCVSAGGEFRLCDCMVVFERSLQL